MIPNDIKADRLFDKLPSPDIVETEIYETKVYNTIMEMAEWKDEQVAQFLRDKHIKSLSMPDSEIRRKVIEEIYTELFDSYFPSPR
jgi:hypothetical protein